MFDPVSIVVAALIIMGLFFMIVGPIGLIRLPDLFTRAHASGKCDTLGQALILLGLIVYEGFTFDAVKLLLLIIFLYIMSPTATHAIVRAAHILKYHAWKPGEERE
ncbi:monovalent cation/H(+) antiporter subunit G [Methanoregula sp.]|uniref:monovalent cation/H(+) antiporter subunit G n=1 Tax=Methanoregula sp. TaxID=2052170 RepID=UPI000CC09C20|nr:monovalent cation/H(+) antiporter subunit G [Methanoregula sp.]PKG33940.1 MAG: cation:proton antiporter [Methanoregula sp.]